ncbi:MAG: AAA family ATPase [Gammaproteobacteria bacterium]|jgi:general secretion pathway protein A
MYESYFGLKEKPFSIAPDPRYIYLSESHEEALAHLLFGMQEGGGFVQLTGEVGTGKTTLVRTLLEQLPKSVDLALVFNPKLSPLEFVAAICDELAIPYDSDTATLKTLTDALNDKLLQNYLDDRRTVLIIDEAQALSVDVLEQVRLLTNLETTREKLLQIILIGQPELRQTLAREDMRQLAQRVTDVYHLEPLDPVEIRNYLAHRLTIAGANKQLYNDAAIKAIYRASGGIPRIINEIADKALLAAYAKEKRRVDKSLVQQAASQVLSSRRETPASGLWWGAAAGVAVFAALFAAFYLHQPLKERTLALWHEFTADKAAVATATKPDPEPLMPMLVTNGVSVPYTSEVMRELSERPQPPMPQYEPEPEEIDDSALSVDFEEWVLSSPAQASREEAFAEIFSAWDLAYDAESMTEPCDYAAESGLQCLALQGNWSRLFDLDRPSILQVRLSDQQLYYLAVMGIDEDRVVIHLDDEVQTFSRREIDRYWYGDFELLWQMPPTGYRSALYPGESGPEVEWLRDRLQEITGDDLEPEGAYNRFDERLAEMVRQFQIVNSLKPDAIVGVQTIIRLNSAAPSDTGPRLRART